MSKKHSKRYQQLLAKIEKGKTYTLEEAVEKVRELKSAKFDETVEVALRLGVNPKHADQNIRGSVILPHGTGKTVRVAVFAKGTKADEARECGADVVGAEDLIEEIKNGKIDFDIAIATPDMMGVVGKIGKILGPRGLMPNPKTGTVTMDVCQAIKNAKAGQIHFKVDRAGNLHARIGKVSFSSQALKDNLKAFIAQINRLKPSSAKGRYIRHAALSLTMSPSVEMNTQELMDIK